MPSPSRRRTVAFSCAICLAFVAVATSVPQQTIAENVLPVTHATPIGTDGLGQSGAVRFHQQRAQVGDRVSQQVAMELNLQTSFVQSGQLANQQDTSMKRGQRREVDVLEVAEGRVRTARVTFPHSRQQLPENGDQQEIQPVEGKTYLLTREGDHLLVKYEDGTIPPQEEFEIVVGSLLSFGKPNPLAKFLLDREFQVGQAIDLPLELAQQMLGFGSELGEVSKFQLTLQEVKPFEENPCAVFEAKIQVGGGARSPISMAATGPVIIRLDTCRTVLADFSGPMTMNSIHNTEQGSFQHQAEGSLRVAIRSSYLK